MSDIPNWQARVLDEKGELDDRIAKLAYFLDDNCPGASEAEVPLLEQQYLAMKKYSAILRNRVNSWPSMPPYNQGGE